MNLFNKEYCNYWRLNFIAKVKFERKHLTEEEKNKLFHIGKESTEDEEKKQKEQKK